MPRAFADVLYSTTDPVRRAAQRYEAAISDALGALRVAEEDLEGLSIEEARMARTEGFLEIGEAEAWPLRSDEDLARIVTEGLAGLQDRSGPGRSDAIRTRYAATYLDREPPVRRAGDAYEARQGDGPWVLAENLRHRGVGSLDILQGVVLCTTAPHIVACSWAQLGCAPAELDDSGAVDADDVALFGAAIDEHSLGASCDDGSACGGADLDASGVLDESDMAFMQAAEGCVR